ncbi:NACHT domain-containing NTPase [Lentzea sp. CC55]|uniref:NACHT domain-containing protein n=1 Tax=Lentzea sp. CC55 TaxID=2884909 RepID=UPI001F3DE6DF|nr:AAA family ATPase [Lentzea sp. CC55]MCG8925825.1 AAA family ATPase [Lentzea sp. CC55]
MGKTYGYADAVKLLGKKDSALVNALDKLAGAALLGGVPFAVSDLLGWFDAKTEFVRLSRELLLKLGERRHGLARHSYSERLHAAHTVIVVVGLFEALKAVDLPFKLKDIGLDKAGQTALVGLSSIFDGSGLLPSANRPYEVNLRVLGEQYRRAGRELLTLLQDKAVWQRLDDDRREHTHEVLTRLHGPAVRHYEELIRKLVVEYQELGYWLQAHHNAHVSAGLARLEESLESTRIGAEPDERRRELANRYRAVLDRPIIDPGQVPQELEIPLTRDAYVDPDFQVVPMTPSCTPALLEWWEGVPARSDLHQYLVGYLTSPKAVTHPLVVLGDPGSGKSLLTKVLAARLPASDFLTVRIELRSVATEEDLRRQVDLGLSAVLQEDISFVALAREAGDALPVVLLDGFDELLQATGVTQTDFLEHVQTFQRRRAEAGRPVAVVVTSRISVSSGMRIPPDADVLRLVPFSADNMAAWLAVWNSSNERYFAEHDLKPLPVGEVLVHRVLAEQPLLLLMLALYDASGNALQRQADSLGRADLYEKLLYSFASREVGRKYDASAAESETGCELVERELERLSVVAFAMFHRGGQWVAESDIDEDMTTLLRGGNPVPRNGMRKPLSESDRVVGRFFFVQCAKAMRDEEELRTYEFLHATFGEYLVARLTWCALMDLHDGASRPRRITGAQVDDSFLYALLSFTPLTSSVPVIEFLVEQAGKAENRTVLADLVTKLFALSQQARPRSFEAYQPVRRTVPARHAVYSLNLVLLSVVLTPLCSSRDIGVDDWPKLTTFWKSQLSDGEWRTLIESLYVRWDEPPVPVLGIGMSVPATVDTNGLAGRTSLREAAREARFTGDPAGNEFNHAFEALPVSRYDVHYARALVQLAASPVPPWERAVHYLRWADRYPDLVLECLRRDITVSPETLRELAKTGLAEGSSFVVQLCDRIGRGGPDSALLDIVDGLGVPRVDHGTEIAVLDAWLRLHEQGYRHPPHRRVDLMAVLRSVDFGKIRQHRPDLVYRAGTAAHEIGLFE